jgi:glutamine amidotransferase
LNLSPSAYTTDFGAEKWVNVPTNSILTIHGQTVMVHPIVDGFSVPDPYHKRSSHFAHTKGLTTNEKARSASPLATPDAALESQKSYPSTMIPSSSTRSRTPETHAVPLRTRTPLSVVETPSSLNRASVAAAQRSDISSKVASQGNIKKKRRSLNVGELPHPAEYADAEQQQQPDSPVQGPSRSDLGTSEKAARVLGIGAM